jgi:hypothetical protein
MIIIETFERGSTSVSSHERLPAQQPRASGRNGGRAYSYSPGVLYLGRCGSWRVMQSDTDRSNVALLGILSPYNRSAHSTDCNRSCHDCSHIDSRR